MFKGNNKNTRAISMTSFWCFIVNFEHIPHFLLFLTIVDFEQVNVGWEVALTYNPPPPNKILQGHFRKLSKTGLLWNL